MNPSAVAKVLVLDSSAEYRRLIKRFCDENNLVALKVRKGSAMSVLRTNIDLGGILYCENYADSSEATHRLAQEIRAVRPELPIFLRREKTATLDDLPEHLRGIYCACYVATDTSPLRKAVDDYLFCMVYPNALLRGMAEITENTLRGQFKNLKISIDTPYIVRDRVIFGQLFSLIQLESNWCRGYMMLQLEEAPLLEFIDRSAARDQDASFRDVNDLLSETTNLIWGAFKNRYIFERHADAFAQVQVPLIVNHEHKYISFGTENPQLCFRITLTDEPTGHRLQLYERFIFNLNWSPDDFKEAQQAEALVAAGELELF